MNTTFKIGFALLSVTALACSSGKTEKSAQQDAASEKVEVVRVTELQVQQVARSVEYSSTLLAYEEIHMAPASPGRIENIAVEVGTRVNKGDLLVQMDRTQLHQAEVQLRTLETDFKRFDTLHKVGSVAQQQYDQMKSQLDIARSNVAFLQENTRLRAPFSGVISGKYFESGEMYSGAPVAPIGKAAIVSLVQIDRLKTLVPVSEKYFPMIRKGMEVNIGVDIYPGETFKGRVFNIYPTIDAASRTFNIEVAVDNPGGKLRPGMFSRVTLDLDREEALLIPAIAVLKMQGSNDRYLFIEKDNVAKRIPVVIGKRYNELVEVESDQLKKGDLVVVSGQARLLDGMKVKVDGK
ncbi:RND family efflux transporter, MFP subunit [Lentimicrobium saccharophilum]|uniref:RND family efflux transporter, MFP subunit n=1 Tax=Lentimicrobium saccharophilum TaxID=1678841 RepID=A0A0S7C1K0_9BACT|nr:efflux RND transporter periplasmic adaptor subunit [Lentimicrobium saccharophilum]GAP43604.1 RND family efflux transporter, MFP subunit [Lentimicrobium saccharophilum]